MADGLADELAKAGCAVRVAEPLSRHTSMGVGGPADIFASVPDSAALAAVLRITGARAARRMVIGRGTNLIPSDAGFRGVVIGLGDGFAAVTFEGTGVRAGAATLLAKLVDGAAERGMGGLEFAAGIPGSLGGAVVCNAGTAEEWMGSRVVSVTNVGEDGNETEVPGSALRFSYRSSSLKGSAAVLSRIRLGLTARPAAEVRARTTQVREGRRGQPVDLPSAGCAFRNPPGDHAGRLIDAAGLKGFRVGGIEVSPRHANFLVNRGGGRSADVVEAMQTVRERVWTAAGILLEPEVVVLDEEGRPVNLPVPAAKC